MENLSILLYNKIKSAKKILVATHPNPDGDAVSSVCAIVELAIMLEKPYFAYCADKASDSFNYLPHFEKIRNTKDDLNFKDYDTIIFVDYGNINRIGLDEEIKTKTSDQVFLGIDHHPKNVEMVDFDVVDTKAVSTTEIIFNILEINKVKINKNLATCILTGLLTDTANFLYPNTTDRAVKIASEMLIYGANYPQITKNTWYNKNLDTVKLWGKAMVNLEVNPRYNIAFTALTPEDIKESGVSDNELEGLKGFLANMANVKAVLFLREDDSGNVRVSLRSSDPCIDWRKLATRLGGGGHPKACAFRVKGRLEKTAKGWKVV